MQDNTQGSPTPQSGAKAAADEVRAAAGDSAARLRESAQAAAEGVRQDMTDRAEAARSSLAEDIDALGRAIRRGGSELPPGSPQARAWDALADGVGSAAGALKDQDMAGIARSLRGFARDNPATFLGGAMLLGFVATRFARASAETAGQSDAGSGQYGAYPPDLQQEV